MNTDTKAWRAFAEYYQATPDELETFPGAKAWDYWLYIWNLAASSNEAVNPDTKKPVPVTVRGWLHKLDQAKAAAWTEGYEKGLARSRQQSLYKSDESWSSE